ncbi:MAG: hypothetical protein GY926_13395 [bacterium]|nr:hypothetical protein [bacterium]
MLIRVDFDALMEFGGVYRTLSESLERRGTIQLDFAANQVQAVVQEYGLEVHSQNPHFAGKNMMAIRDDAVARSHRVSNYLMACSSDLFRHAGEQNQIDNRFDWSSAALGAVWTISSGINAFSSDGPASKIQEFADPIVGLVDDVFKLLPRGSKVGPLWDVVTLPLNVSAYFEALETIRSNPWEGWFDGIGAGLGITGGLIGIAAAAGAAPVLVAALPYIAVAGAALAVIKLSPWDLEDIARGLGGALGAGYRGSLRFVDNATDALADFGGDVIEFGGDVWDSTVDFGKGAWNWAFGSEGVVNEYWERAVDSVSVINGMLGGPLINAFGSSTPFEWKAGGLLAILGQDVRLLFGHGPVMSELLELSPEAVAGRWAELSPSEQKELLEQYPDLLGNLDGIPYDIRFKANRARIETALIVAKENMDDERIMLLEGLADDKSRQFLFLDIYAPGGGRIAEVHGRLSTAQNVIVIVPGIGNDVSNFQAGADYNLLVDGSRQIYEESRSPGRTAVVAWLGYDAPRGHDDPQGLDPAMTNEVRAREGAAELRRFLAANTNSSQVVSLIGHSYGSTTAGIAASEGLPTVDNLILLGSPGGGADHVSAYQLESGGRVFASSAPNDEVKNWTTAGRVDAGIQVAGAAGGFVSGGLLGLVVGGASAAVASAFIEYDPLGKDPTDPSFGATVLDPGDLGDSPHGEYLREGSLFDQVMRIVEPPLPGEMDLDNSAYRNMA